MRAAVAVAISNAIPKRRRPPELVALRPTYQISLAGREGAEVRKHFFTPFGDRFTIDVPGPDDLEMEGDLLTTSSPSAAAARRWRRSPSGGSACATPTRWTWPPARTIC